MLRARDKFIKYHKLAWAVGDKAYQNVGKRVSTGVNRLLAYLGLGGVVLNPVSVQVTLQTGFQLIPERFPLLVRLQQRPKQPQDGIYLVDVVLQAFFKRA